MLTSQLVQPWNRKTCAAFNADNALGEKPPMPAPGLRFQALERTDALFNEISLTDLLVTQ